MPIATDDIASPKAAVAADELVIPLIDFSNFLQGSPDAKAATAKAMTDGFRTAGFIYLINHGIPKATVQTVFGSSAKFFERPQDQKDSLGWTTPESNRGYVSKGREKVTQLTDIEAVKSLRDQNPDLKESIEIGREGVDGHPNQWPDRFDQEGADFTKTMKSFFLTCKDLHIQVMRALALGLGLDEQFFDEYTDGGDNTLRLLHYPPAPKSVFKTNVGQVRAGEHTDYGSVTLLFQDMRGGLQVKSPRDTWVNATPIEDSIVINAGDLLARWSNDEIKSTKHRVVEPPPLPEHQGLETYPARYSTAYFCNPNFDKLIDAIPGTFGGAKGEKKYDSINSGDYLTMRLAATY